MAVEFKWIADESEPEPSICIDFSNLSDTSSSISTEDEEINKLLQRRTSVSLFNVSTPLESNSSKKKHRYASHHNIHTDRKKRIYRSYSSRSNKTKEERNLKVEFQEVEAKEQNSTGNISPNFEIKYAQALNEIETLQIQINKLKSEHSITPLLARRKSLQSSMIKTCLFKNSSTAIRPNQHNSTRSSLFGTNSTCMTIDIEDDKSPRSESEMFNDFLVINTQETKDNPFLIKSESPTSYRSYSSCDPLIAKTEKFTRTSKVRNFMCKFMKCPEFLRRTRTLHNKSFCNKISPIPKVVIISPTTPENDSGNDSGVPQIRLEVLRTPNVEKLMKDMSKCAAELSEKLNTFSNILAQCMNQKNVNS